MTSKPPPEAASPRRNIRGPAPLVGRPDKRRPFQSRARVLKKQRIGDSPLRLKPYEELCEERSSIGKKYPFERRPVLPEVRTGRGAK